MHQDIAGQFVPWVNDNGGGLSCEVIDLDHGAKQSLAVVEKSNLLSPLFIGRIKVGYATDSETQGFYQQLLKQEFCYRLIRGWRF